MSGIRIPKILPEGALTSDVATAATRTIGRRSVGTVGRESGQVRLRVVEHTDGETLLPHVHSYTASEATLYTDEWRAYERVSRVRCTVRHGEKEWARDDDGDGIREVHINTIEGLWTTVRNFLRILRGVHKKYLGGYVAMCEFSINLKRTTPAFISSLVALHPV